MIVSGYNRQRPVCMRQKTYLNPPDSQYNYCHSLHPGPPPDATMSILLRSGSICFLIILSCLLFSQRAWSGTKDATSVSPVSILLPVSFLSKADAESLPVNTLLQDIRRVQQDYLDTLDNENPFYGLYIKGEYDQFLDPSEDLQRIGVEWEFFDDGWNDSLQRIDRKKLEIRLQFLQMLANMQQKKFMEKLSFKNRLSTRIRGLVSKKKAMLLHTLQQARKKQFENGYATKDDYLTIHYKYQNSALLAEHYENLATPLLTKGEFDIINRCETLRLLPLESLLQQAVEKSVQIQIQNLFIQRSEFFPSWSDDLRLKLFAENTYLRDGNEEKVMGISFRLPLQTNGSRETLVATEQDMYIKQKLAIRKRLEQRIPGILETLRFHQQRVIISSNEYALMRQRFSDLTQEEKSSIPILDRTPKRSLELLKIELLDKEMEILLTRLKVYEELIKLQSLVQSKTIADLLEPQQVQEVPWTAGLNTSPAIKTNFRKWLKDGQHNSVP